MSGNDWCRQKEETDGADCTSSGRLFQKMEAATGNERRPAVDRRYCGTCSCSVNDVNTYLQRLWFVWTSRASHAHRRASASCEFYSRLNIFSAYYRLIRGWKSSSIWASPPHPSTSDQS